MRWAWFLAALMMISSFYVVWPYEPGDWMPVGWYVVLGLLYFHLGWAVTHLENEAYRRGLRYALRRSEELTHH